MQNKNINEVLNSINIINVINQLKIKKIKQVGYDIYAICPFCQTDSEKRGKLKANIQKNVFLCNGCETSGTSIDLYSKVKLISRKTAYKILLHEKPLLDGLNSQYIFNNPLKDEEYRNMVYAEFLELHKLSQKHEKKLKNMGFSKEYIEKYKFKSIEDDESKKKKICEYLQNKGYKLEGIPGFFKGIDFKWTYNSHEGIFIPVCIYNKIQGLRIFLDKEFDDGTENIWFSSNNKFNGTKSRNWPLLLKKDNLNWTELYNSKKSNTLIIATEILVAYKLFNEFGNLVLGIPNNINRELLLEIINKLNIDDVYVYFDKYSLLNNAVFLLKNTIKYLEQKGIKTHIKMVDLLGDKKITSKDGKINIA